MSVLLQTEYDFTLPRGYVDGDGAVHRQGVMRLATAGDEIAPYKDPRVQANPAYLAVILLSRVTNLEGVEVNPKVIEGLFASDLSHLQRLYNRINTDEEDGRWVACPQCEHRFQASGEEDAEGLGG
jgi:hypothetical protein